MQATASAAPTLAAALSPSSRAEPADASVDGVRIADEETIPQVLRRFRGALTVLPWIETNGEEASVGKPLKLGERHVRPSDRG